MDQRSYWDERARSIQDPQEVVRGTASRPNLWLETYHRRRLLRALVQAGRDGLCLDAACGLGVDFPDLVAGFRRVVGLDFSVELLRRSRASGSGQVHLVGGDLAKLPVASGRCDAAVCISALQCLSDEQTERAIVEFSRVLRPGGRLALHVKNSRPLQANLVTSVAAVLRKIRPRVPPPPSPSAALATSPSSQDRYRPCQWYLAQARAAGFVVEWEAGRRWFYRGFLRRYGMERLETILEAFCAVLPPTRWLTRHWGIDHFLVLRRT